MLTRFQASPLIQSLFSNIPIEAGQSDAELAVAVHPPMPHKTFSRLRIAPPKSISSEQLLFIARLTEKQTGISAADVIALARTKQIPAGHPLQEIVLGSSVARSLKSLQATSALSDQIAASSRQIRIFDRADSFAYLRHVEADELPPLPREAYVGREVGLATSNLHNRPTLYKRGPRITVHLTHESITTRQRQHGDGAIEQLLHGVETREHSLAVISDEPSRHCRIYRGVFENASAVVLFDNRCMVVSADQGRRIRRYDAADGEGQRRLIRESVRHFAFMRRFMVQPIGTSPIIEYLRSNLSYRLPWWPG